MRTTKSFFLGMSILLVAFSFCTCILVKVYAKAYQMSEEASFRSHAMMVAMNQLEIWKTSPHEEEELVVDDLWVHTEVQSFPQREGTLYEVKVEVQDENGHTYSTSTKWYQEVK